ncbi:hypothetical protein GALL_506510 [mine drainage metagenome]|uniref:Uncharacterized protein n=1 Tax=mine drainage metagenome TaxID=410659 RepID=A0A1J5PAL8_9ZZZZ
MRIAGFYACKVSLVAVIIYKLYILYSIGRQVLCCCFQVASKKVFSVYPHFGNAFTLEGYVAVCINISTGHFFNYVLNRCAIAYFIGGCIKLNGVFFYFYRYYIGYGNLL